MAHLARFTPRFAFDYLVDCRFRSLHRDNRLRNARQLFHRIAFKSGNIRQKTIGSPKFP